MTTGYVRSSQTQQLLSTFAQAQGRFVLGGSVERAPILEQTDIGYQDIKPADTVFSLPRTGDGFEQPKADT